MSHIVSNQPMSLRSLRFSIARSLLTKGLLVALLGMLGTPVSAQVPVVLMVSQRQEAGKTNAVAQQLQGQWQTKDSASGKVITFIFAPDGNLFTVVPAPDGSSVAIKMGYEINTTTQPMQLDMKLSPDDTAMTVFELTPKGTLRLELDGISPEQPRPSVVSSKAAVFEKVSDATTVPQGVQVVKLETQKATSGQSVVKQYLTILNEAQQDYYQKNGRFAADIEELKIITTLETENYRYQIVPQKDNKQSVMIAAIAKNAELPSYTSAVFATQVKGETTTTAQICATEKPSTSPPAMPAPPTGESLEIQCPAGSRSVQ